MRTEEVARVSPPEEVCDLLDAHCEHWDICMEEEGPYVEASFRSPEGGETVSVYDFRRWGDIESIEAWMYESQDVAQAYDVNYETYINLDDFGQPPQGFQTIGELFEDECAAKKQLTDFAEAVGDAYRQSRGAKGLNPEAIRTRTV